MRTFLLFLLLCVSVGKISAQQDSNALSDAEKIYGLSKFWSEAKYNFVFYDRIGFDWDSLYRATIPEVLSAGTVAEYYDILIRFAVRLGDGHTGIGMPQKLSAQYFHRVPMHFELIGKQVYVKTIGNDRILDSGIGIGDEIIAVNETPVLQYVDQKIAPYISTSTPQWLQAMVYDKGYLTQGHREQPLKLTVKDCSGRIKNHTFPRDMEWEKSIYKSPEHFGFKVLEGNVGHLTLRRFWGEDFENKFAEVYPEICKTDGLIIDIRYNDGGNTAFANLILQNLTSKPFYGSAWSTRIYKPAFASWGYPEEWYAAEPQEIEPKTEDVYTKPVVVLIDHETFSAGEDFCIAFRNMERGVLIGRPTGGSTGNPIFFNLPGGGWARICSKKDTYPDGTEFVGIGVLPDIEVEPTLESLINGDDLHLKKALQTIKGGL